MKLIFHENLSISLHKKVNYSIKRMRILGYFSLRFDVLLVTTGYMIYQAVILVSPLTDGRTQNRDSGVALRAPQNDE